jgi:uncharacterized tellurite resistance protein B-like protein
MDDFDKKQGRQLQNLAHLSPEALMEHMQKLTKGSPKGMDVPLATAIVLLEVASSDHMVDRFEKSVIHNGLKSIFRISDQQAASLVVKAKAALGSMRSSSAEASMLRDILDPASKKQVANLIDTLIRCNGVVDSMEVYLRQRFRSLLGLPDEPLPPRSDDY